MTNKTAEIAEKIAYNSTNKNLSEEEIVLINSFNKTDIISELKKIFFREKVYSSAKSRAFNALLSIEMVDVVELIIDIFNKSSMDWRTFFCSQLALFQDKRAISKLTDVLLKDKNANVRYCAAEALGIIGDDTAIEAIKHAIEHDKGKDFEGFTVAEEALNSLQLINSRVRLSKE